MRGHILVVAVLSTALLASPARAGAADRGPDAEAARVGPAPAGLRLKLVLPLAHDASGLARFATAVTTPGSPSYGRYASIAALARRFGASPLTRARVVSYLRAVGASAVGIDSTGLFADATLPAATAQRLFAAPLVSFRSALGARFVAPVSNVRVPAGLRGLVTGVVGLDTEPLAPAPSLARAPRAVRARAQTANAQAASGQPASAVPHTGTATGCAAGTAAGEMGGNPQTAGFTPNQYLTAYGFDPLHAAGVRGQGVRVALIEIDGFKYADLKTFAACFGLDIPALNAFAVGVPRLLPPGGEATLDLEVLDAAAPDLKAIDVYETTADAADTLKALTAPLHARGFHPQVISASLGLCEGAVKGAVGRGGLRASEGALEMAAASGITFLASSGDQGSADCTGANGAPLDRLAVNYPSSSPWVTGVGGTNLLLDPSNQITQQVVWNDTNVQAGSAAGGGSSKLFRRPSYQAGVVGGQSRGVPDLSMLADIIPGYAVFCSVQRDCVSAGNPNPWQSVGGTSAATPLAAGGFALVDQQLRAHQRQDLGLANPLLYELGRNPQTAPQVFSDVIQYSNDVGPYIPGDGQPLGCCSAGPGYDLASGWGSVDMNNFVGAAILLQPPQIALTVPRHQHPIAHRELLATVTCGGSCRLGALAEVRIGRHRRFTVRTRSYLLGAAGRLTIPIRFSHRELRKLRAAAAAHRRIRFTIFGVLVVGPHTIQSRTAPARLRL